MGPKRAFEGMGPERAFKRMGPERALKGLGPKSVLKGPQNKFHQDLFGFLGPGGAEVQLNSFKMQKK